MAILEIVVLVLWPVMLTGCGSVESVVVGSTVGMAGNQGVEYFLSGKNQRIFYRSIREVDDVVKKTFVELSFRLEKRQRFDDDTLRYLGEANEHSKVSLQVELRPIAEGVTEVTVVARKEFYMPDAEVSHLLMRQIMQRLEAKHLDARLVVND